MLRIANSEWAYRRYPAGRQAPDAHFLGYEGVDKAVNKTVTQQNALSRASTRD